MSCARFCGRNAAAAAAVDGTVSCWDLSKAGGTLTAPSQVMRGHAHRRNFVGLSVLNPGAGPASSANGGGGRGVSGGGHILACGSEDAVVHTYHTAQSAPFATWPLLPANGGAGDAALLAAFSGGKDEAVVPLRGAAAAPQQQSTQQRRQEFVSSVAWAPPGAAASEMPLLAVAASDGELRVLSLQGGCLV